MPANENPLPSDTEVLVTTALLARVEALESENSRLRTDLDKCKKKGPLISKEPKGWLTLDGSHNHGC